MIKGKKLKLLEHLAKYKFLSRKQLARIGLEKYNSNFSGHKGICTIPEKLKLIGWSNGGKEDIGYVYYLTKKGAMVMAEHYTKPLEKINFCRTHPVHSNPSIEHTVNSVWCQIECEIFAAWNDLEIDFYLKETEKVRKKISDAVAEGSTRVSIGNGYLQPDAIFSVNNKLFTFEYENENDPREFLRKMDKHCQALYYKSVGQKMGVYNKNGKPKLHRSLFVFQDKVKMKKHIELTKKNLPENYLKGDWILFKHIDDILPTVDIVESKFIFSEIKDYFSNWTNFSGEKVDILA